jgi:hypothetical protein
MASDQVLPRYIGIGFQLGEREPGQRAGPLDARFATGDDALDSSAPLPARSQLPIGLTRASEELPIDASRGINNPDCPEIIRALRRNHT